MKFTGSGSVWNPTKNKLLVNFNKVDVYETMDANEIEIMTNCVQVQCVDYGVPVKKEKPTITKNEVMSMLDELEIKYNPRDKKEVLIRLL